jgi:hypothetical protein
VWWRHWRSWRSGVWIPTGTIYLFSSRKLQTIVWAPTSSYVMGNMGSVTGSKVGWVWRWPLSGVNVKNSEAVPPHPHLSSWLVREQLSHDCSPSTSIFTCLLSFPQLFIIIRLIQCPHLRNKLPWHSSSLTSQFLRKKSINNHFWVETCGYVKTSFASVQPKL